LPPFSFDLAALAKRLRPKVALAIGTQDAAEVPKGWEYMSGWKLLKNKKKTDR
jgi:hypothetical protein